MQGTPSFGQRNGKGSHSTQRDPLLSTMSVVDLDEGDDPLQRELAALAAENRELMASLGIASPGAAETSPLDEPAAAGALEDQRQLQQENQMLREQLAELQQMLAQNGSQAEQLWAEQQREYEMLLEEKSEVIRSLHQQLQDLRDGAPALVGTSGTTGSGSTPNMQLHATMQQELAAAREQLERERQQLQEDEEDMMRQMREMELAMSKERVEMARQRAEVQRMYQEFQRELEMAQRDAHLRERLSGLQRRHQDAMQGVAPSPGGRPGSQPALPPRQALPTQTALPRGAQPNDDAGSKGSGLLKRLFG